ncbi:hypothetical protein TNCV_4150761 [Trichonephila clavipes]|nr:hypothetical protein TNCV_4150761 [Trichonephila clavipes]
MGLSAVTRIEHISGTSVSIILDFYRPWLVKRSCLAKWLVAGVACSEKEGRQIVEDEARSRHPFTFKNENNIYPSGFLLFSPLKFAF